MAFPGGAVEREDFSPQGEPDYVRAALRETQEEVGLAPEEIQVAGLLPPIFTVSSHYWVMPVLGWIEGASAGVHLKPDPSEVDLAYWASLELLGHRDVFRREAHDFRGQQFHLPAFYLGAEHVPDGAQDRIWGVTGMLLHNLLERFQKLPRASQMT